MADYESYKTYISSIINSTEDFKEIAFKTDPNYMTVLENINKQTGVEYLQKIEEEFPEITIADIKEFTTLNDKYGQPAKTIFTTSKMKLLYCSPSCMRYVLHALKILRQLKENATNEATTPTPIKIVEIGAGHGALYLALNIFAPKMGVSIDRYYIIDLPEVIDLLKKYISLHVDAITIPLELYDNITYVKYITDTGLFLISNYGLSAFENKEMSLYMETIVKHQVSHGFLTWQTCFGADIDRAEQIIGKTGVAKKEEEPQTGPPHAKNYYVTF
jgi:hypothetical protein